ncbi:MAG: TIGR01440 family protein [Aerococcus sp.]|nr:TIGR01440 family protein [Aerococcus sp.]
MMLENIEQDCREALEAFFAQLKPNERPISLFVLGCSTSEIQGEQIGQHSNVEVGRVVIQTILTVLKQQHIALAVQCCEHLNRALIVERQVADDLGAEIVQVVPIPHAGGAAATMAYELFDDPVVIEHIQADGGLDIGGTAIGMHVKHVQIPKHLKGHTIGEATVMGLASRPKLIGGERAYYGN